MHHHLPLQLPAIEGRIHFASEHLETVRAYLLEQLEADLGANRVRRFKAGEYVYPNIGIVSAASQGVSRDPGVYANSLTSAVAAIRNELVARAANHEGPFVLDLHYSDEITFRPENCFGDFIYLSGRLLAKGH